MAHISVQRKSGFIRRGGVMRRESLWFAGFPAITAMGAASTAVLVGSLNAAALALRPFTIVRTRGTLFMQSDQQIASEDQDVAFGQAVVSDQAVAIGITAIPTPSTDDGSDLWFVYERLFNSLVFATAAAFDRIGVERVVDSRAQRKVQDGEDMIIVAETSSISSGAALFNYTRVLIKLH